MDSAIQKISGDKEFLAIIDEIRAMHIKKGADYGTNEDTFANIRASEEFGILAWSGAILRANDKMSRIKTFCIKGTLANEGVEDSLLDLANYAIIALCLFREAYDIEPLQKGSSGSINQRINLST